VRLPDIRSRVYGTDFGAATGRRVAQGLVHSGYRCTTVGAHHVPISGPVIVAANHPGAVDGAILIAIGPRPLFTIAKSELFVPVVAQIFQFGGLIPVEYDQPDRTAILRSLAILDRGGVIGIFPEAHRGRGEVDQVRTGVAYLALRSGAAVVPLALFGTRRTGDGKNSLPRIGTRIDSVFGKAFVPAPHNWHRRSELALAAEEIRARLAAHVLRATAETGRTLPTDEFDAD
jgi:1-acyl-sn-glycerol-3-phosphate acyltransferase